MRSKADRQPRSNAEYYDSHGVLDEINGVDVQFTLEDGLRQEILAGKRRRKLRNFSVKIDPLQLQALKRIATSKGVPYQTLVRQWLVEKIKKELKIA
ncbi:MAG: BrnA antitoxin family protein [Syntrophales bacterium LBB04]|nr:BrnA antitoxin family protein [Syntrophales bacterium LBB04]